MNKMEQCRYCNVEFMKRNMKRHESTCKYKDDPVRNAEIKLGIEREKCENICRFCKKEMRADNITRHEKVCKAKQEYHEELKEKLKASNFQMKECTQSIGVQGDHNNVTYININLLPFGKEYLEHITPELIAKLAKKYNNAKEQSVAFAMELTQLIFTNPEHPENHNIKMGGMTHTTAKVYNGKEFVERKATEVSQEVVEKEGNLTCEIYEGATESEQKRIGEKFYKKIANDMASDEGGTKMGGKLRKAVKKTLYTKKK